MVTVIVKHRGKAGINLILRSGKVHVKTVLQNSGRGWASRSNYIELNRGKVLRDSEK